MIPMKWKYLKAFNDLYIHRRTSVNIEKKEDKEGHDIKKRLIDGKQIIIKKPLRNPVWIPLDGFNEYYEKYHKDNFEEYQDFFKMNDIPHTAKQTFIETDIQKLIFIKREKEQILAKNPSEKEFLSIFFGVEAKYFSEDNISMKKAVLKILGLDNFEGDDNKINQWRFVVDCPAAKCVVLCENKDRLTLTKKPLENFIELWYVGGNNTPPLERLEGKLTLPIFYTCDWDLEGLRIFSRVKKIIENLRGRVYLLIPPDGINRFDTITKYHKSDWEYNKELSGLDRQDFPIMAQNIIKTLIQNKKYIQEEGIDLVEMVNNAMES